MSRIVTDKLKITKKILSLLVSDFPPDDLDTALYRWWRNPRTDAGLRLTELGAMKFDAAGIEYTEFFYNGNIYNSKNLLKLSRLLESPYHLSPSGAGMAVRIYDERIVTLIILYGSLEDYINSLEENNSD
jgi:hypothetical protein